MGNTAKFKITMAICLFLGISCAPYVNYQPQRAPKAAKSAEYNISVYHELDPLPPQSLQLGKLTINNKKLPIEKIVSMFEKFTVYLSLKSSFFEKNRFLERYGNSSFLLTW